MTTAELHHAIWDGEVDLVDEILQGRAASSVLEAPDAAGNTPLMLALRCIQPAQHDLVCLLLRYGASAHARDARGWTCIQNATLCDDDRILAALFVAAEKQTYDLLTTRSMAFCAVLHAIPDFYVEIRVELTSWVPLVSKALPSDVLKIWKKGPNIRCDFTIKDLHNTSWKRGHMSHVLQTRPNERGRVATIDRDSNTVYDVTSSMAEPSIADIETGLQVLYTCKTSTFTTDVSSMVFAPKKKPLLNLKASKHRWPGTKYEMLRAHVNLRIRQPVAPHWKRTQTAADERLTKAETFFARLKPPVKKNAKKHVINLQDQPMEMHLQVQPHDVVTWRFETSRADYVAFHVRFCPHDSSDRIVIATDIASGATTAAGYGHVIMSWERRKTSKSVKVHYDIEHQRPAESAAPIVGRLPAPRTVATPFDEYFKAAPCEATHVARRGLTVLPPESHVSKDVHGTVTMTEAFPFAVSDFLPVAHFLATRAEHFDSLREFFEMKLPPGFPTKFQLPILLSIRASYTFEKAELCTVDDAHFDIDA
ncbi:hypothetical protein ACHHYP_00032 [Achlya hypogyna]|uniref:Ankyrin repeat domain-containing protein n=1 Tax=Achlya hypogyna TaxID=1202772 RepID=A0A1V9ZCT5_ACHHY|nr:hypothetical protein ACHHYP_00032 [Achlya hypogyna]